MTPGPLLRKFVSYLGVGGVAAVVDLGGFVALERAGVPDVAAAALSFLVAAGVNFLLSARFVFGVAPGWARFGLFLAMNGLGFLVNVSVTAAGLVLLGLAPALAKLCGIGVAFGFNFLVNVTWVFAERAPAPQAKPPLD